MYNTPISFVSRLEAVTKNIQLEDIISEYKASLGEGIDVSNMTFTASYDDTRDGYQISVSDTSYQFPDLKGNASISVSTSDNTTVDPSWKWVQTPNIWTSPAPNVYPSTPGTLYPADDGSTVTILGNAPAELSEESKALLKSVEEKVSELLGKHPYARLANMRKALDEFLAAKPEAKFEGCFMVDCLDGKEGWVARYTYNDGDIAEVETGIMPTEIEAIAELIRMVM